MHEDPENHWAIDQDTTPLSLAEWAICVGIALCTIAVIAVTGVWLRGW